MLLVHKTEFALKAELLIEGVAYKEEMLDIGDVIVSENTCVEIKRGSYNQMGKFSHDFVASIKDQRLKIQCSNMKDNFNRNVIILQDFDKIYNDHSVAKSAIVRSMTTIATQFGISIIPTITSEDTVKVLSELMNEDKSNGYFCPTNIHPKPKSMAERQIYFLTGLIGIEYKKATQLLEHLKTPFNVIKSIVETDYVIPKRGKNKKMVGVFTEMKGFGPKFVDQNKDMLTTAATQLK